MKEFIANKTKKLSTIIMESLPNVPYATIMKVLRKKDVKVNGRRVNKDVIVNEGDKICVYLPELDFAKYTIIYQDDNVVVVDKKSGVSSEELFDDLQKKFDGVKFIHRLDTNTTGLMIFALNDVAEQELLQGFKQKTFIKEYTAKVIGKMPKSEDILTAYLLKDEESATVKIYDTKVPKSVLIKTGYKVVETQNDTTIIKVRLYTGKTHQIRAHLAHVGNPVVGDGKYGDNAFNRAHGLKKQQLRATSLTLSFSKDSVLNYLNNKTFELEF